MSSLVALVFWQCVVLVRFRCVFCPFWILWHRDGARLLKMDASHTTLGEFESEDF